jgi:hypothetical protein
MGSSSRAASTATRRAALGSARSAGGSFSHPVSPTEFRNSRRAPHSLHSPTLVGPLGLSMSQWCVQVSSSTQGAMTDPLSHGPDGPRRRPGQAVTPASVAARSHAVKRRGAGCRAF